jgi:cytochrome P450
VVSAAKPDERDGCGWDWARPDFQERLYEIYRELRDHHPLTRSPHDFWAVSRFADVFALASDTATFSSERTVISPPGLVPTIQSLDPPRHDRLRALVSLAFTPKRVREMEPRCARSRASCSRRSSKRGAATCSPPTRATSRAA